MLLSSNTQNMVFVTLEVPQWVYPGHLIGPHGNNIRMIQDHCHGVKIDYQPKEKRYESYNEHIPILKYIETLRAWEQSSLKFSQSSQEIGEWMTMAKGHKHATYKLLQNN